MTFFSSGIKKSNTRSGVRTPTGIDDVFAWFAADSGVYKTGATCVRWQSKTNGHHLTASATHGPQYVEGAINGKPSLDFLNNGDWMANDSPGDGLATLASGSAAFSIFIVASSINAGGTDTLMGWAEKGNTSDGTSIWAHPTTGLNSVMNVGAGEVGGSISTNTLERNDQQHHIYSTVFGTVDNWVSKVDGIIKGYYDGTAVTSQDARIDKFEIGRRAYDGTSPWWGGIAEIIIYDRELTTEEVVAVEEYLFDKYYNPDNLDGIVAYFKADNLRSVDLEQT